MDTSISLRINGNPQQWGGSNSSQGERQNRRKQKLEALLHSIIAGDLEIARQAFIALVNFDPSVSTDPYLTKIGTALQSSNLYAAKHFAQELQSRGGQLQSLSIEGHGLKHLSESFTSQNSYSGPLRVDLSAWVIKLSGWRFLLPKLPRRGWIFVCPDADGFRSCFKFRLRISFAVFFGLIRLVLFVMPSHTQFNLL